MASIRNAVVGGMSDLDAELTNLSREYAEALLSAERAWNLLDQLTDRHELYQFRLDDWNTKESRARALFKKMKEKFLPLF